MSASMLFRLIDQQYIRFRGLIFNSALDQLCFCIQLEEKSPAVEGGDEDESRMNEVEEEQMIQQLPAEGL